MSIQKKEAKEITNVKHNSFIPNSSQSDTMWQQATLFPEDKFSQNGLGAHE